MLSTFIPSLHCEIHIRVKTSRWCAVSFGRRGGEKGIYRRRFASLCPAPPFHLSLSLSLRRLFRVNSATSPALCISPILLIKARAHRLCLLLISLSGRMRIANRPRAPPTCVPPACEMNRVQRVRAHSHWPASHEALAVHNAPIHRHPYGPPFYCQPDILRSAVRLSLVRYRVNGSALSISMISVSRYTYWAGEKFINNLLIYINE